MICVVRSDVGLVEDSGVGAHRWVGGFNAKLVENRTFDAKLMSTSPPYVGFGIVILTFQSMENQLKAAQPKLHE